MVDEFLSRLGPFFVVGYQFVGYEIFTMYLPGKRSLKRYLPSLPVVWGFTSRPNASMAAEPSELNRRKIAPFTPWSPGPCWPFPFRSRHTKSPTETVPLGMTPASIVGLTKTAFVEVSLSATESPDVDAAMVNTGVTPVDTSGFESFVAVLPVADFVVNVYEAGKVNFA